MKILISAAEVSSDTHGAELLKALRSNSSPNLLIDAFGIGGPKLKAAGLRTVVEARDLLSMGFLEVIVRLPKIFRALRQITEAVRIEKPDIAVVIDYPDFHFILARRLKKLGVPVVYYIPPKVWVWRKGRIHALRKYFVRVLSILPFEEEFYRKEGVPVKYVGNPLVDELPLDLSREQARKNLGLGMGEKVVVLMPGSRPSELRNHLEVMLDAVTRAAARLRSEKIIGTGEKLKIFVPFPMTVQMAAIRERVDAWLKSASGGLSTLEDSGNFILDLCLSQGNAPQCMAAADAGLIKSGTSTLEAGLMGCPHAIVFKPNIVTTWIFRYFIRYRGPVGLVNLVAQVPAPYLVPEILCEKVTPKNLADELVKLFSPEVSAKMREGFGGLRKKISHLGDSPSRIAADEILNLVPAPSFTQVTQASP